MYVVLTVHEPQQPSSPRRSDSAALAPPLDQEARQALFGGCGNVPDIPALQAWLECAWRVGFDPHGAEQLGGRVQGSRWVLVQCGAWHAASCSLHSRCSRPTLGTACWLQLERSHHVVCGV